MIAKKFRFTLLLFILLFFNYWLSSCAGAAIVAGAAAGGSSSAIVSDKRSFKTMNDDHRAATLAQKTLNKDTILQGRSHVSVAVYNKVALLVGQAETAEVRARAYTVVSRVKNINKIYNRIQITKPISYTRRVHDTWITTKVRSSLLAKHKLHSNDIKVLTENGVVYLMGDISREQAVLASDAARRIDGVKQVVLLIQYTDNMLPAPLRDK